MDNTQFICTDSHTALDVADAYGSQSQQQQQQQQQL